jgi:uncharacterized repeat protein (TIGR01451 family)
MAQQEGNGTMQITRQDASSLPLRAARTAYTPRFLLQVFIGLLFVIAWTAFSGCSRLRLPAIDPSGNRFFSGTGTNLTIPQVHATNSNIGVIPSPGFREPPPPPACLAGPSIARATPAGHKLHKDELSKRGRCGQLLLTPTRIVAPVNGDVVLLSGVCGEDGYLVSGQKIEWMLSPDSVGQIIDVGDDGSTDRSSFFHRDTTKEIEKLGIDFARGVTATNERVITRGSPKQSDDLIVRKGQTWLSLTSPSEGITRVTALAPDAEVWDRRRQTATIYWVDARWDFPEPINLAGTQQGTISTSVTQSEGLKPATGWIVRYTSQDPRQALFLMSDGSRREVVDATVDLNGKAEVQVVNASGRSGSALISIEVNRPAQADENMPQITLGRGQTVVSWSAAELLLQASGPQTASVNDELNYTVVLKNFGSIASENTRLTLDIPANMRLIGSSVQPTQQSPSGLVWDVGVVNANNLTNPLIVTLQPNAESDYRIRFTASNSAGQTQSQLVPTLVTSPRVSLRFGPARGSEQVELGALVQTELVVTNTGRTAINNMMVTVETDVGLQSVNQNATIVESPVGYLAPGDSRILNPAFVARRVGPLNATAIAKIGNQELARQTTSINAVAQQQRMPAIGLTFKTLSGTEQIAVGNAERIALEVANTGQVALQDVQVVMAYSPSLQPSQGTTQFQISETQRQLIYNIPLIEVGQNVQVDARFECNGREANPQIVATAQTRTGVRQEATLNLQPVQGSSPNDIPSDIRPPNEADVRPPSAGSNVTPPRDDLLPEGLAIELIPIRNQVSTNSTGRYELRIKNNRSVADQSVDVVMQFQQGLELKGITTFDGRQVNVSYQGDGSSAQLEQIRYMNANETLRFIVEILHTLPGTWNMRAVGRSSLSPQQVIALSSVTVTN